MDNPLVQPDPGLFIWTIVKNAERQIQLETGRALQQIRREAVDLSVMIASKLIQRNISKEDNDRLINDALAQLQSRPQ